MSPAAPGPWSRTERAVVAILLAALVVVLVGCGPSLVPDLHLETPKADPVPAVAPTVTPAEDLSVRQAQDLVDMLRGRLSEAEANLHSRTVERNDARIEAQVKPIRAVLMCCAAAGALGIAAGVALFACSFVWTFGFGRKFGLGIAAAGACTVGVCLGSNLALSHPYIVGAVVLVLAAIGIAIVLWRMHADDRDKAELSRFGNDAKAALKTNAPQVWEAVKSAAEQRQGRLAARFDAIAKRVAAKA